MHIMSTHIEEQEFDFMQPIFHKNRIMEWNN